MRCYCDADLKAAFNRYAKATYKAIDARTLVQRGEMNEAYALHYEGEAKRLAREFEDINNSLLPR
jgi:hypothetical protein